MACPEVSSIGLYLLGVQPARERLATERHLSGCESCQQQLIELAALPGLLHRLTLEDVTRRRTRHR